VKKKPSARGIGVDSETPERSGVHPSGLGWPDTIVGAREIASYLRIHQNEARLWCREGRIPAQKDGKGRWMVHRLVMADWFRAGVKLHREKAKLAKGARERSTWTEEYKCGCDSKPVTARKKLVGYCPTHGESRVAIYTGEQMGGFAVPKAVQGKAFKKELEKAAQMRKAVEQETSYE